MQYKCLACHDTGSISKHMTGHLDCISCSAATVRVMLEAFIEDLPAMGERDKAWVIHQRALAIGLADAVEGVLTEMQPGGALHMPQETVAHLKYWAAQRWSGCGDHEIEHGEGLEVCEPGEIGADGLPAFPVFMHAIPGALAMAPKLEAPAGWKLVPKDPTGDMFRAAAKIDNEMFAGGSSHGAEDGQVWAAMYDAAPEAPVAAPAAANGAPDDSVILPDDFWNLVANCGGTKDLGKNARQLQEWVKAYGKSCAAAGPDAALATALESALAIINNEADPYEYADSLKAIRAALSGAKGN